MKKIIIVKGISDDVTYSFADDLAERSISSVICDKKDLTSVIPACGADAVFSLDFDEEISDICKKTSLPGFFWIYSYPAPNLFCPALADNNNRIFIPDRETYEIFRRIGLKNVFFPSFFSDRKCRSYDKEAVAHHRDRIMMGLETDEKNYLKGLLRARDVFPDDHILFYALPEDLIAKMYSLAGLSDRDVLLKKRYVLSECIFGGDRGTVLLSPKKQYRREQGGPMPSTYWSARCGV